MINGEVSFWWSQLGGLPQPRPALPGNRRVDVCIVGAGYTGLWTAYYLKRAQPSLKIAIVEAQFAGFGASGRNGGWLTNSVTGGREQYVAQFGLGAAGKMQTMLNETVAEVINICSREGIEADIVAGGEYILAQNPAQQARLVEWAAAEQSWPMTDAVLLSAAEARQRVNIESTTGALWQPHAARIHPAKLVSGLARVVEATGVSIYESTSASLIEAGRVVTDRGVVTATTAVIRATEGFTANLKGLHRAWLPMNSSMIATAPLPDDVWNQIGWAGHEVVGDMAHSYFYAQRTSDNRIAIGGRGVPYRFGSRTDNDGSTPPSTVDALTALFRKLFPAASDAAIDHAWSGVLGVPRDWSATVGFDQATRVGWAGGYVGTGVTATNLAGRTLADLVLGRDTDETHLPWVNHRVRNWEVEPLRWLAVRGLYSAYRVADASERSGRATTSPIARIADVISGRKH